MDLVCIILFFFLLCCKGILLKINIAVVKFLNPLILFLGTGISVFGCVSGREFWTYVVDDSVTKPLPPRAQGKKDAPPVSSQDVVRVVYSDGTAQTEVFIPVLSSGQQILIDQKSSSSPVGISSVPFAPIAGDKTLEDAYVSGGLTMNGKAPSVSIIKTQEMIRKYLKTGDYSLALQYAEQILAKYPQHVETLRTKGSLLLKMGEKEAALATYLKAQEIEPSSQVNEQINKLESRKDRP